MQSHATTRTYGTVSADRQKAMSGLEFVQGLADGTLPLNTIARTLGYEVAEVVTGRVAVTAQPTAAHLNPAGTVHGGFAATLLDSCMGLAIHSTLEKGSGQTTLEFKISLVRPITPRTGLIRAEGVVMSRGRRVGEGRLTDGDGRLLGHDDLSGFSDRFGATAASRPGAWTQQRNGAPDGWRCASLPGLPLY